jgi:hypothetical protein
MKRHSRITTVVILAVTAGIAAYWLFRRGSQESETNAPATSARVPAVPAWRAALKPVHSYLPERSAEFGTSDKPEFVRRDLDALRGAIAAYHGAMGECPSGEDSAAICRALMGLNPRAIAFFPADHPRVDAEGHILDAWGTPFHLHPVSRKRVDIRSAGPDRIMGNGDDWLVAPYGLGTMTSSELAAMLEKGGVPFNEFEQPVGISAFPLK